VSAGSEYKVESLKRKHSESLITKFFIYAFFKPKTCLFVFQTLLLPIVLAK
jgi:hypothetical protein